MSGLSTFDGRCSVTTPYDPFFNPYLAHGVLGHDPRPHHLERVDHDVADALDLLRGDPFPQQVLVPVRRRRPEDVGDRVGDDAVDLLGHGAVERAQPRLQVRRLHPQLHRRERAGDRRVHVPHHHDQIRPMLHQELLVGDHHLPGLLGVRAAAHPQVEMRLGQHEVPEEGVRHVEVVVLAGVHDDRLGPVRLLERVVERRDLHEVRPGGGD